MGFQSCSLRSDGMTHKMAFFNGQSWSEVQLPQALTDAGKQVFLNVLAVTSDRIILWGKDMGSFHLLPVTTYYQIDLTGGNYRLEEIAKLTQEWLLLEQE